MEQGFQTEVDQTKNGLYRGTETDRRALPAWLGRTLASAIDGPAPDQATQLTDALNLAYCQPAVAAFFNFELADEPSLAGWQSGLLWTDRTPKPSYQPFKAAVRNVASGRVDCVRYARAAAEADGSIGFSTTSEKSSRDKKKPSPPVFVVK
jgi:hypothetical protein